MRRRWLALLAVAAAVAAANTRPALALLTGTRTVTGNTFATAASFCTPRQGVSFLTGFEYGQINALGPFDGAATTGGTPVIEAVPRSGAYALKLPKAAGGTTSVSKAVSGTTFVTRFAVRFDTLPVSSVAQLATVSVSSGSAVNLRYNGVTKRLGLGFGVAAGAETTAVVAAATWYVVDLAVDTSANPRTARWRVDGVAQTSVSAAETAAAMTALSLGSATLTDAFTARYDDLVVSATAADYPIGDGRVLALLPTGASTASGAFQDDGGGAIDAGDFARVDDIPMSSVSDYIKQWTTSLSAYVQLDLANTSTAGCINGVYALASFHSANTSGTNSGATRLVDGTTESVVYSGSMAGTSLQIKTALVRPAAATWSSAALNGLVARIGYAWDVTPVPYWDAVLVEYDSTS